MNPAPSDTARRPWVLLFIAVCLVAINLRTTITGVGPLLAEIAADQGVSPAALGALASVPLLAWGLFSPLAHGISARIGTNRAVSWSLVVLMLGTIWRSLPGGSLSLWLGTGLIGLGLAIANVLMPAVVKRDFGTRIPLVMGAYTALLSGSGAIAAGLVVPISELDPGNGELGWRIALLITGVGAVPALAVWIWATRGRRSESAPDRVPTAGMVPAPESGSAGRRIWGDPTAWFVSIYMGSMSAVFYMQMTWLAPFSVSLGRSAVIAGVDVMIFQVVGIAASLLLPAISAPGLRRILPAVIPIVSLFATVGFLALPALLPVSLVISGLASGASLTTSLTLTAVRARTQQHATALSGMAQSVGYLIAAAGPIAFGWLHGATGGWILPFAFVWLMATIQLVCGVMLRRERFVLEYR